jgi:hypothetical protein
MEAWLEADKQVPRKQRHTAKRIFDRLQDEYGFRGCERSVRKYIASVREKPKDLYLPLAFKPGEMAQADWTEDMTVVLAGKPCKLPVFAMVLNHRFQQTFSVSLGSHIRLSVTLPCNTGVYSPSNCSGFKKVTPEYQATPRIWLILLQRRLLRRFLFSQKNPLNIQVTE